MQRSSRINKWVKVGSQRDRLWTSCLCTFVPPVIYGIIQMLEVALSVCINLQARWNDRLRNPLKMSEKTNLERCGSLKRFLIPSCIAVLLICYTTYDVVPCKQHCYLQKTCVRLNYESWLEKHKTAVSVPQVCFQISPSASQIAGWFPAAKENVFTNLFCCASVSVSLFKTSGAF